MKTLHGAEAAQDFATRIKSLKDNHTRWCAVIVTWLGKGDAPWLITHEIFSLLSVGLSKELGNESGKCVLLALPSGALLWLGDNASNTAYQKAHAFLKTYMDKQNMAADCTAYDLSATWNDFLQACRAIYTSPVKAAEVDKGALLKRLDGRLGQAGKLFEQRKSRSQLTLLFVEDEPSIRQLLNTLLAHQPFNLRFAANGEEAIISYADFPPHIAFLDINLPDISGLDVLDMIAKHDKEAYPIMLTGNAGQSDVSFAKERGIKGYIVKPFSWQKLSECLQRYQQAKA